MKMRAALETAVLRYMHMLLSSQVAPREMIINSRDAQCWYGVRNSAALAICTHLVN